MNVNILKELLILLVITGGAVVFCLGSYALKIATKKAKIATKFIIELVFGVGIVAVFWLLLFWIDDGIIRPIYIALALAETFCIRRIADRIIRKRQAKLNKIKK